jgi:hypothetical protein
MPVLPARIHDGAGAWANRGAANSKPTISSHFFIEDRPYVEKISKRVFVGK